MLSNSNIKGDEMRRLLTILALATQLQAALNFTGATDRVDYGTSGTLSLNPMTVMAWIYSPGDTVADCIVCKGRALNNNRRPQFLQENADTLSVTVDRATTDTTYLTTGTITLDAWQFVAFTFDSGASAGEVVNIYSGSLTAAPTEFAYTTSTDGSGAVNASAEAFVVGNNSPFNTAYEGRIAWVGAWNVVLTADQIKAQWMRPRVTSGCVVFSHLYGSAPANLAGNALNGATTGATTADHVPLGPFFGFDWRDATRRLLGLYA